MLLLYEKWWKIRALEKFALKLEKKYGLEDADTVSFKIEDSYTVESYSEGRKIYLPLQYFNLNILKILLEKEFLKLKTSIIIGDNNNEEEEEEVSDSERSIDDIFDDFIEELKKLQEFLEKFFQRHKEGEAYYLLKEIITNNYLGRKKAKRLNLALTLISPEKGKKEKIFLFFFLSSQEKERIILELQRRGFFKKEKTPQQIIKIITSCLEDKNLFIRDYKEKKSIIKIKEENFQKLVECINEPSFSPPLSLPFNDHNENDNSSDGAEILKKQEDSSGNKKEKQNYDNYDEELEKKLIKILENFLVSKEETRCKRENWCGKRINRRVVETAMPPVRGLFYSKEVFTERKKPKILAIVDFSGSMAHFLGRTKAFLSALLKTIGKRGNLKIVASNSVFNKIELRSVNEVVGISEDYLSFADEAFDVGWDTEAVRSATREKPDIVIVVTDLIIDREESDGLFKFLEKNKKRGSRVYILRVSYIDTSLLSEEDRKSIDHATRELKKVGRVVAIDSTADLVNFLKKLAGNFTI